MGIKGLMKFLADHAPNSIRSGQIKNYFGRKIAIDANMSIYQFLISIRGTGLDLTDDEGFVTSHLQGLFYRSIKFLTLGIKPVYVFDGKPPEMKSGELQKRKEKKKKAEKMLAEAKELGDEEKRIMWSKRVVRVTREQQDECKKLLRLMGIPIVESPSEAESQCAELVKGDLVYATGTEDMDALTFGTNILIRNLSISDNKAKKTPNPIKEIHLDRVLEDLNFTMDQFIDFCILCGCDYCDGIRGIGPIKAFKYIKQKKTIEKVVKDVEGKKGYVVPTNFLKNVETSRKLFRSPDVVPAEKLKSQLKWVPPREEELINYLVVQKKFDRVRVENGIKRLKKSRKRGTQQRLTNFFKIVPNKKLNSNKRKRNDKSNKKKKKRKR